MGGERAIACARSRSGDALHSREASLADLGRSQLEAVFTADIHRHARIIDLPSGTVEVAFDQGVLKSGDRSMPVSEIELELKSGSASAIYELAYGSRSMGAVRPSIRSKSARGFDLAADTPPPCDEAAKTSPRSVGHAR